MWTSDDFLSKVLTFKSSHFLVKCIVLKSFLEILRNVLLNFRASFALSFLYFAKIISTNMSTYLANFRYVACALLKLQTQFACKYLVFCRRAQVELILAPYDPADNL